MTANMRALSTDRRRACHAAFTGRLARESGLSSRDPARRVAPIFSRALTAHSIPFSWSACWRLCLPAAIIGTILRVLICIGTPEAYYGSDSNSYFETAHALWNHGDFEMGSKRRGAYPLLLAIAPVFPGNTVQVMAVFQHALAIAALFAVGWITGHVTRRRMLWVPIVTCVAALLPQPLWYEHEIIADSVVVQFFIVATALAFPTEHLRGKRLMWFLIAAGMIVACKPHGRPLWLGLVASAVLLAGNPLRWGWQCLTVLAATVVIILGTGSSKQGSWLLMSSALPLIDTEKGKWPQYRKAIAPLVAEAREDIPNYPWRQGRFKKRVKDRDDNEAWKDFPEWQALLGPKKSKEFSSVAKRFALEAIVQHPLTFTGFVLKKLGMVLSAEEVDVKLWPRRFWHEQADRNSDRWTRDPKQLELLYEMNHETYMALEGRRARTRPTFDPIWLENARHLHWVDAQRAEGAAYPSLSLTWCGALGLLGVCWCLTLGNLRRTSPLWLPCLCYLGLIYVIGDAVRRYLIPVEWLLFLFAVLGAEWLIDIAARLVRRRGDLPAKTPVPAQ
jgi:hypothetical protein